MYEYIYIYAYMHTHFFVEIVDIYFPYAEDSLCLPCKPKSHNVLLPRFLMVLFGPRCSFEKGGHRRFPVKLHW